MAVKIIDQVVELAKHRGFVFQSGEIYGGTRSAWDYGPVGVELKENIKRQWLKSMVQERADIVGIDSSIILPREVWIASGHESVFTDPLTECLECHKRFRADSLMEEQAVDSLKNVKCPNCGVAGKWTEAKDFNMMLRTHLGPTESENSLHYLRPETAQGIFVNFANMQSASRLKLPFGIAQVGKSFRNEITPGNFIFRTREFEQMEMEYFVKPGSDEDAFEYWKQQRMNWYTNLGIKSENLRFFDHPKEKLSHYSKATTDIEYKFGFDGSEWGELEGIANRTDFDLKQHSEASGKDLRYFDSATEEKYFPFVIEPSGGLTRSFMAFLIDAYDYDEAPNTKGGVDARLVLRLDKRLAPFKAAVLPLSKKDELSSVSAELADKLRKHWMISYDDTQAIGRRYRRQDEIGTPYCVTIDFESLEDKAATVRDRDSMKQERIKLENLEAYLKDKLEDF